jgi:hypothetical protein
MKCTARVNIGCMMCFVSFFRQVYSLQYMLPEFFFSIMPSERKLSMRAFPVCSNNQIEHTVPFVCEAAI